MKIIRSGYLKTNLKFAGLLTFINAYDVKFTTRIQNVFMFTKILALLIIIIGGIVWMCQGKQSILIFNVVINHNTIYLTLATINLTLTILTWNRVINIIYLHLLLTLDAISKVLLF